MKILIVQLARLGDIYMTWPVARAIHRKFPEAEIHFLVRPRFKNALNGLEVVHKVWELPMESIFKPIFEGHDQSITDALLQLDIFCNDLIGIEFQQIINLSFSPSSSYMCHFLAESNKKSVTTVRGYTRHTDGFLNFGDPTSAYFYAQVGFDKPNRIHLIDLFANIGDVELIEEDWGNPVMTQNPQITYPQDPYIVIHVGASELHKSLSVHKWIGIINGLLKACTGQIVLIGTKSEIKISESIACVIDSTKVLDLVGKTQIEDLFSLLKGAQLLIGADSAPMHMASFTQTKCLNISIGNVSFWETGPRVLGSVVLKADGEGELPSDLITDAALDILNNKVDQSKYIAVTDEFPIYQGTGIQQSFEWDLIKAIYLSDELPPIPNKDVALAFMKLKDANDVALEQLDKMLDQGQTPLLCEIYDRTTEIINSVGKIVPEMVPLIRWLETEKIKMGPAPKKELILLSIEIHKSFASIVDTYCLALTDKGQHETSI